MTVQYKMGEYDKQEIQKKENAMSKNKMDKLDSCLKKC